MQNQTTTKIDESVSALLTNERYRLGYSQVKYRLEELNNKGLIDAQQFEKIRDEDILLKVKYKTYKKCLRNMIIGLLLIGISLVSALPLLRILIIPAIILLWTSFFGILSNRLSKAQMEYMKN